MRIKTLTLIAAGVAALSIASVAIAADTGAPPVARVRYGDLNLSNDAGVAHLYARLRHAADQVCELGSFRDIVDQGCATQALDAAVAAVGNERLTALHARSAGSPPAGAGGR